MTLVERKAGPADSVARILRGHGLEEAQALLRIGVDGIITNNPSVVWEAVAGLE